MNDLNLKIGDVVEFGGIEFTCDSDDCGGFSNLRFCHYKDGILVGSLYLSPKGLAWDYQTQPVVKLIKRAKVKKTFERELYVSNDAIKDLIDTKYCITRTLYKEPAGNFENKIKITFEAEIED